MTASLAFALLLVLSASLSTYHNNIHTHFTSSDINSIISIGHLTIGDHLKVLITFPEPTSLQP